MKGINLRRKVNFIRKICKDEAMGELHGQPIVTIIEDNGEEDAEPQVVADDRLQCQFCNRFFDPESHPKHQNKCASVFMGVQNRRQPFQSICKRLSEDEQFQKQIEEVGGIQNALAAGMIKLMGANSKLNESWRMQ